MEEALIPWSRLAAFIRQHTHDVRNDLNSMELESVLLQRVAPSGEAQEGIARIRRQLRSLSERLRTLSATFQEAQPIAGPMPAKSLLTIWQDRHAAFPNAPKIDWKDKLEDEQVSVDVEMMATVFQELLANAAAFPHEKPVTIESTADKGHIIFRMREPKTETVDTSHWGQPLFSTRRKYGLGLFTCRRLVEAQKGRFHQKYLPKETVLLTEIILPQDS